MITVDMSPKAVTTRLKRVSQLRRLCLALAGPRLKREETTIMASRVTAIMVKEATVAYPQKRIEVFFVQEGEDLVTVTVYVFYGKWE